MGQAVILVLAALLVMAVWNKLQSKGGRKAPEGKGGEIIDISDNWVSLEDMPFQRRESMLSVREQALYSELLNILHDSGYVVFPHVRLSEVIDVPPDTPNASGYVSRARERGVDLLICRADTLVPVLGFLFVGQAYGKKKQRMDSFTEKACKAAAIPCISFNVDQPVAREDLRHQLVKYGLAL